jgi:hypothetical protein
MNTEEVVVEVPVEVPVETVEQVQEHVQEVPPESVQVPAEEPVVVVKKKRKRTQKQIDSLEKARKSKAAKRKKLSKPVKIERKRSVENSEDSEDNFSWSKECLKASLLAGLGLASVFVQQKLAQKTPVVAVPTKSTEDTAQEQAPPKRQKKVSKDPFASYRH